MHPPAHERMRQSNDARCAARLHALLARPMPLPTGPYAVISQLPRTSATHHWALAHTREAGVMRWEEADGA